MRVRTLCLVATDGESHRRLAARCSVREVAEVSSADWTRENLRAAGFVGWVTFEALMDNPEGVPQPGGVYIVAQADGAEPEFLEVNPGGRFKDRDQTVAASALRANWVDGAEIVHIGKANNLRRRLREFSRFGADKPIGHWGGRLIWQLTRSKDLLVAWRETPGEIPKEVETMMLTAFRADYGHTPRSLSIRTFLAGDRLLLANRTRPRAFGHFCREVPKSAHIRAYPRVLLIAAVCRAAAKPLQAAIFT